MKTPEVPIVGLHELKSLPMDGGYINSREKLVYKMGASGLTVAAKIFHPIREWELPVRPTRVDRDAAAKAEFTAHTTLQATPLGLYVPEPHFLLKNRSKKVIGLATEWIDNKTVATLHDEGTSQLPSATELKTLWGRLEQTQQMGVSIDPDMLSLGNVMRSTQTGQLFFGECWLEDPNAPESNEIYNIQGVFKVLYDISLGLQKSL